MLGIPAAVKWAMILGLVLTTLGSAWGVVRYIQNNAIIRAQRDALIELAKRQAATVEDKNKITNQQDALPDDRVRWCAIKRPLDVNGCCSEKGPCPEAGK